MALRIEPKFHKGDYITNRTSGDIAIVKDLTKKGYYVFTEYYDKMFDELKDLKKFNYELQINYQTFFDLCNDEEKAKIDGKIKEKKGGN